MNGSWKEGKAGFRMRLMEDNRGIEKSKVFSVHRFLPPFLPHSLSTKPTHYSPQITHDYPRITNKSTQLTLAYIQ